MKIEHAPVKIQISTTRLTVLGTDVKMNPQDQADAESVAKVDRIIERVVIDWLQFGDTFDENRAQNALTLIHNLKTQLEKLQSENARIREGLEKYSNKDNWDIFHVCDSYSGAIGCLFRLGLIDDSDKEGPDYAAEALSQTRSETTTGAGEKEGV